VAIVGIVPGIVYAVCGWGVRAGKRPAATVALWLATIQFVVLGLVAAAGLFQAWRAGVSAGLLSSVALWAIVLVPLGLAITTLRRVRYPGA
jgi:hypothetical protein